jgi:anaerobic ribonucleoside-triphosphate reductase activating protein
MIKYTDVKITFSEVPNEITLCINISNCPCHCTNCHSSYLARDIGTELSSKKLIGLIEDNRSVSCISFMGGDASPSEINYLAKVVKMGYDENIKVAWYSGRQELSKEIDINNFDFIKLGPYIEELGPLNVRTTNQKFYKVKHLTSGKSKMYDATHLFWKND